MMSSTMFSLSSSLDEVLPVCLLFKCECRAARYLNSYIGRVAGLLDDCDKRPDREMFFR